KARPPSPCTTTRATSPTYTCAPNDTHTGEGPSPPQKGGTPMQCRYCGAELPDGCAFCSQCGQPQQTDPAPPAPAAAPAAQLAAPQAGSAAPAQTPAAPRKSPLKILLWCILAVVVIAVI